MKRGKTIGLLVSEKVACAALAIPNTQTFPLLF
jgi:hypothetical protein